MKNLFSPKNNWIVTIRIISMYWSTLIIYLFRMIILLIHWLYSSPYYPRILIESRPSGPCFLAISNILWTISMIIHISRSLPIHYVPLWILYSISRQNYYIHRKRTNPKRTHPFILSTYWNGWMRSFPIPSPDPLLLIICMIRLWNRSLSLVLGDIFLCLWRYFSTHNKKSLLESCQYWRLYWRYAMIGYSKEYSFQIIADDCGRLFDFSLY